MKKISHGLKPMIMYENEIYYYIADQSEVLGHATLFDGSIESEIESSKIPTRNSQANFGKDYKYVVNNDENTIEVYIIDGRGMVCSKEP